MKTRLWLLILVTGFLFASCDKEDGSKKVPDHASAKAGKQVVDLSAGSLAEFNTDFIGAFVSVDLIAGQHMNVGKVIVEIDDDFMIVTYKAFHGGSLRETHLHIGGSSDNFPLTNSNNPQVGRFAYSEEHDFLEEYTYRIPVGNLPDLKDGKCYYIAAHAVVNGSDKDIHGFTELLLDATATLGGTEPNADDTGSYFPKIIVNNNELINGEYPGWCLQADVKFYPGRNYNVHSSYGDNSHGYDPEFLNKLNWLLNQRFQDKGENTHGDVQMAIWVLKLGKTNLSDAIDVQPELDCDEEPRVHLCGIIDIDEDRINSIVSQANANGKDFVPGCGDVFAIVFTNSQFQDVIIEYPVPCQYGQETAWGDGERFNQRGNWAMYFKICQSDK